MVDTDAARMFLVKACSPSLPSCKTLEMDAAAHIVLRRRSWDARVPTMSSPSDPASRLEMRDHGLCARAAHPKTNRLDC